MVETVEQNGVKFTPEKVVNIDEMMKQPAPDTDGSGKNTGADTDSSDGKEPSDVVSDSEGKESNTSGSDDNKSDQATNSENSDDGSENIPLDEIYFNMGDKEVNASELVSEYEKLSNEVKKIKEDAFLGRFIEFYQNGGDAAEFLSKATANWENVSDVELLRMQFNEQNSDLDKEARDILFERELLNKYSINPDGTFEEEDSREAKLGKQLMRRDASKLRAAKVDEQKSFLLPQRKDESQRQVYDPEKYRQELLQDQDLKSFVTKKSLPVGDGMSYEVKDPSKIIGMMANVGEFWQLFQKPDGSWDKNAVAKVFAFASDPKSYDDHILRLGQGIGSESYIKDQKNTAQRGKTTVVDKSTDRDTVSVRDGRIVGSNKEDLLKAFLAQKSR